MENYAVVRIAHRQYVVEPNKTYTVDKFAGEVGDKVDLEVLLKSAKGKLEIGNPLVEKSKVTVEVINQGKDKKVTAKTYKAKARYRRKRGHRQHVTTFKVLEIK